MANSHQPPIVLISANIIKLFHDYKPQRNNTGLYICSTCDSYIPIKSKIDWLQHTQDFHKPEFDKLVETQYLLTRACSISKADDHKAIIETPSSFRFVEEKEMVSTEQEKEDIIAQLDKLLDQYKNGSLNIDDCLDQVKEVVEQAKN
ncbi:unnamed protein product [Rotaria magnacalcarata]|uniref:Uncharacterized protein n=1 Tax=Rotaria magnacalcarata TaxID=392030 RepID=A0A816TZT8_9BILA|nr:unnamed protein product [Rotaria magnacalcarata]CAF4079098.1 unnamed protein product [Rotaria magnacalcarata]